MPWKGVTVSEQSQRFAAHGFEGLRELHPHVILRTGNFDR